MSRFNRAMEQVWEMHHSPGYNVCFISHIVSQGPGTPMLYIFARYDATRILTRSGARGGALKAGPTRDAAPKRAQLRIETALCRPTSASRVLTWNNREVTVKRLIGEDAHVLHIRTVF